MTKIKVCGITLKKDAQYCALIGVDYIGFIFYPKSKRFIEVDKVKKIVESIKGEIKTIGVFVNETSSTMNEIAQLIGLDYLQLHGVEPLKTCNELRFPYIKNVRGDKDIEIYKNAKFLLVDAQDKTNWGGLGKLGDWEFAKKIKNKGKNLILSGGLNENNINKAINTINPDVVDICSSLETAPGIKNLHSIKNIFDKIKLMR